MASLSSAIESPPIFADRNRWPPVAGKRSDTHFSVLSTAGRKSLLRKGHHTGQGHVHTHWNMSLYGVTRLEIPSERSRVGTAKERTEQGRPIAEKFAGGLIVGAFSSQPGRRFWIYWIASRERACKGREGKQRRMKKGERREFWG